jgi:hypothetical protein
MVWRCTQTCQAKAQISDAFLAVKARINRNGFHDKVFQIPDSFAVKSLG